MDISVDGPYTIPCCGDMLRVYSIRLSSLSYRMDTLETIPIPYLNKFIVTINKKNAGIRSSQINPISLRRCTRLVEGHGRPCPVQPLSGL